MDLLLVPPAMSYSSRLGLCKLGVEMLRPAHNDELLARLQKCMPITLGRRWWISPVQRILL